MIIGHGHGDIEHAYVTGNSQHSEGHGGTHLYVTASASWTPPELIPEHREALDEDDHGTRKRKLLDLAKKPKPGTTIWRGEVRHKDDLEKPPSVGLHWSVNPDQVISPYDVPKDHHRVIWEAKVDHPEKQTIPRSHAIWYGRHQSMDSEAEVRLHPQSKVRVTRRYVHNGEGNSAQPYVRRPDRSNAGWSAHDMDHHADVAHKRAGDDGLMEYHKAYPDLFGVKPEPREGHSEVLYHGSTHPRKFPIIAPDSFEGETHVRTSTDWHEAYDHASEKVMDSYGSDDPVDHLNFDDVRVYRVEHRGEGEPHKASPTERHHKMVRILHDATEGPHVTGAKAAEPKLTFRHSKPTKNRTLQTLTVHHPKKGPVGRLEFYERPEHLEIQLLNVPREHRGNGYGNHLMDELQRRFPGKPIDHGERTDAGQGWWDSYSHGKEVVNGRTMASRRTASIPPAQRELMALPGGQDKHRKMLALAKDPAPGTHVWRGEVRHKDELHAPESVGLHWTVNPDAVVMRGNQHLVDDLGHSPDHRRVLWQGVVHEPERELIPRSHPIWSGRHQSFDNEAEVRYHPRAKVHLTGAYVYHGDGDPTGSSTTPPDPAGGGESRGWSFHPMDHHAAVHHGRPKGDAMNYQEDYPDLFGGQKKPDPPVECNWGRHPADHVHVWGEGRYDKIPTCHEHDAQSRAAVETMGGKIKETRSITKSAVSVSWGHDDDDPSTWTDDYRKWTQERPHGVAVNRAQEHVRRHVPTMEMELGSTQDATSAMQHMLRRGGHSDADDGFVMKHHDPRRGVSQAYFSDGEPGVALHEDRWDYGTLAHEVAHHLHMHEMGRKPHNDAEAHGPDFIRHYQSVLKDFGRGASEMLGEHYHKHLGRIRGEASRKTAGEIDERAAERGPGAEWRDSLPPEHDELIQAWERAPGEVGTGKTRNQFRKILGTAPEVEGPVYRGDQPKGCFYKRDFEKKHQPGMKVNFSRWSSTSTRPEVAAGFGRVVYEIHGHGARAIGNTLHEGVMPPGKYQVHSAEWRKAPTRAAIDGRTMHESEFLHVTLHPAEAKEGAREPSARLFGPTHGLDHRLFEGEHLKPDVRRYILETLGEFWKPRHGVGWDEWARVYFAGSEASEWTSETLEGNGDFDVLIGVDYDAYRGHQSVTEAAKTDEEITDELNAELRMLSEKTKNVMIPVDGQPEGPFENTWYVNKDSLDIRRIKPYAAYNVSDDVWAVKPPHLEDWDITKFPEGKAFLDEAHAVAAYVRAILEMPEPYRSQQGNALWEHLHSDRSRAFGPQGEGWYDPGNTLEKYLDQLGLWEQLAAIHFDARDHPEKLDAPADWSNDPRSNSV